LLGTAILMGGLVVVIITTAVFGLAPAVGLLLLLAGFLGTLMVRDRHGKTGLPGGFEPGQADRICTAPARWGRRPGGRFSCRGWPPPRG